MSTLEMTSINSWTLKFLSKTKAKSLSDFWKSEYLYWVFWSFNDFFGCFKLSKNISNPTNASTLISNLVKAHPNPILNKSNDFDNLKENELIALLELVELINSNILTGKLINKIVKEQAKKVA